jgi:flagellar biosynthesis regulator FlaF
MHGLTAARAYRARSADRNLREQEADVFRRVTGALRASQSGDVLQRTKALADTNLLWSTLIAVLADPDNSLPAPLRGSIVSVGLAVKRELDLPKPDIAFLIAVNEQITLGLGGH